MTPRATITESPTTIVWINTHTARIVRWDGRAAGAVEVVRSDVPSHRRSTGHVRHDPSIRHGGGGPQDADEPRRLEHVARFLHVIAERLPATDDLVLIGAGDAHEQLVRRIAESDRRHGVSRRIQSQRSPRLTDRQLVARLRHVVGADPARLTVGAYRWEDRAGTRPRTRHEQLPRRIAVKRPRGHEE